MLRKARLFFAPFFIQWLIIGIIYLNFQPEKLEDANSKKYPMTVTPSRRNLFFQQPQKSFRYLIVRYLSNDLPPLHSENQTFLSTKIIVENEKLPKNFYRLWILHSIIDGEKLRKLIKLLKEHSEWFFINQIDRSLSLRGLYRGCSTTN